MIAKATAPSLAGRVDGILRPGMNGVPYLEMP
jgi:hypothetical protein